MKATRIVTATAAVGACVLALAGGCRKDKTAETKESRDRQDLRAQSEGKLQVDQSAVLPVDVRAGVMKEYPGATVQKVTKKTLEDRVEHWEVELTTKDGKHVTRVFDDKGKPTK